MRTPSFLALAALSMAGCSSKAEVATPADTTPSEIPAGNAHNVDLARDQRCPGDPTCAPGGDPALYVGVSVQDITPKVDFIVKHDSGSNPWEFNLAAGDTCIEKATGAVVPKMKCVW